MAKPNGFGEMSETVDEQQSSTTIIKADDFVVSKKELHDFQGRLPIGIFVDGERLTEFTLKPYKVKFDRQLAEIANRPRIRLAKVLEEFLPLVIDTIGGYSVAELAKKLSTNASRMIGGLYFGDALTLILNIRLNSVGEDIKMSAECPACGTMNEDKGTHSSPFHDLGSVEISYLDSLPYKPVVQILLEDGIKEGANVISELLMEPLKLYQFDSLFNDKSKPGDIAMLYEMVTELPDSKMYKGMKGKVFGDELYDEMTVNDLRVVREAIDKLQVSPDMNVPMDCYNCGKHWEAALPWASLRQFLSEYAKSDDAA